MSTSEQAATRRPGTEVRQLILDAAAEEFGTHGYAEASIRRLARNASVSMSVVYRHFPTKADLFRETTLAPFLDFLHEFTSKWQSQVDTPWEDFDLLSAYMRDLHDSFQRHENALIGLLIVSREANPELIEEIRSSVSKVFESFQVISSTETSRRPQFEAATIAKILQITMGTVLGVSLTRSWFPEDTQPTIEEITRFGLYGIRLSPAG